jgi:hypothetical protein
MPAKATHPAEHRRGQPDKGKNQQAIITSPVRLRVVFLLRLLVPFFLDWHPLGQGRRLSTPDSSSNTLRLLYPWSKVDLELLPPDSTPAAATYLTTSLPVACILHFILSPVLACQSHCPSNVSSVAQICSLSSRRHQLLTWR